MLDILISIGQESWEVLLESAPFMLLGFFIAGLLKAFVGPEFISKNLGSGKTSDVLKASILGVPIPLCSCGVIPAAAQLRQQGASKGATTSFLISTPETGVDSIAVTYALLDPVMAVFRPFAAFFTAVVAGIMVDRNEKKNGSPKEAPKLIPDAILLPKMDEAKDLSGCGCDSHNDHNHTHSSCADSGCGCNSHSEDLTSCSDSGCGCGSSHSDERPESFSGKLSFGMQYSFGNLLQDIGLWFLGGVLLAGIFGALIPDGFIERNLGDGFFPLLIMLAAAIPLYVCATASTPIAAALALKGLSPGAALVFLLAGPATNAASFTVVAKLLGKRSAFIYLGSIIVCSLALGMFANWLYYSMGLSITDWVQSGEEHGHNLLYTISALILLALIAVPKVTALVKGESLHGHSH
ncbi:SO_0444 family Cu/Zn efflux transporter [Maridesulfovibrio salexigens]|uniref:Permease n=1 Tax=Maridesulfovibrio salexigens (strain ATCC 14822 / DSM 2638 / NCIMB 8403 / VKM B-1763) TaxID=526222 RepID=C6C113_MARSD|nr:SO_0444 family Cu/Zn efflux transporter [Maridesulfovibrio salexigens]ACS79176.1 permease [Maridesulfovibrio salexigens DSM 2638]